VLRRDREKRSSDAARTVEKQQKSKNTQKLTKNHKFHTILQKYAFFAEDGQFHETCYGHEIMN